MMWAKGEQIVFYNKLGLENYLVLCPNCENLHQAHLEDGQKGHKWTENHIGDSYHWNKKNQTKKKQVDPHNRLGLGSKMDHQVC